MRFEVKVRGDWNPAVAERFSDVETRVEPDCILMAADLDQPGLHGLLERVRTLGFELVYVRRSRTPGRRGNAGSRGSP